jgi:hypothetical protein
VAAERGAGSGGRTGEAMRIILQGVGVRRAHGSTWGGRTRGTRALGWQLQGDREVGIRT